MTGALWPQLLSSALVGTDRRPCRSAPPPGPLAAVLGEPRGELPPAGLLSAAAAVTVARRAGTVASRKELPALAPTETAVRVPGKASERLDALVIESTGADHRQRRTLLREWLELAARKGLVVPPRHVATLIDLAGGDPTIRSNVVAVGGARLGWLASLAPGRWHWIEPQQSTVDIEEWDTGRTAARVRYLESVRQTDPARGRVLLSQVWQQERAADLAALITACTEGLSGDDESWLEKALDDKRVQVREAAAQLLSAIPGSAYRARMADRALACCVKQGKDTLVVTPPAEFDASMRRDGMSLKPPHGWGERAWWLVQIVAAAPLECWSGVDSEPVKVLGYRVGDDWAPILREGWIRAATTQRDAAWAWHLCRMPEVRGIQLTELASILPEAALTEIAAETVRHKADRMDDLLAAAPTPWSGELTRVVLAWIERCAKADQPSWWHLLNLIERSLDPAAVGAVDDILARCEDERYRDVLERLATTLHTRYEMHQEFA